MNADSIEQVTMFDSLNACGHCFVNMYDDVIFLQKYLLKNLDVNGSLSL